MRAVVAAWRLVRAVVHALHGLLVVLLLFPWLPLPRQRARIAWWSRGMLRVLGIGLQVQGAPRPGAKLLVANHVNWLDILVVHAVCPEARFVSKAEVRQWPLVSRLVDSARTLYLRREHRRDALRVVHEVGEALAGGDTVAVFPEGTTGPGEVPLPFHANLLQAAIATTIPVQPLALRYADRGRAFSPAAQWLGEATLLDSLWALARADGLVAHLAWLPAQATAHADRRALAARLREQIAAALPPAAGAPGAPGAGA